MQPDSTNHVSGLPVTETIVSGLILAGVSALAYLAYGHPRQYEELTPWLFGVALMSGAGTWIWAFAIQSAQSAVMSAPGGGIGPSLTLNFLMPPIWLLIFGWPAVLIYILVLRAWVETLKDEHED